jgi:hypothetical protein
MRGRWVAGLIGLFAVALLSGCASKIAMSGGSKPTLAVFPVESKRLRLKPAALAALQEHATTVMATSDAFDVVPYKLVERKLRRRRRRAERTCHRRSCQVKIGRRVLKAGMSQATLVSKNMLGQCDVFAFLHDLGQEVTEHSGRHRASGCELEQLARAVSRVTCHIIQMRRRDLKKAVEAEEAEMVIGTTSDAPKRARPAKDCLARAAILWLERKQEDFATSRPGRSRKAKQNWTQQLAGQVMDLKRDYDQVARYPSPTWAAVAVCRTGRLYERLADKTAAAYGKQHQQAAEQQAGPFRQQAIQIYEACLAQVKKQELAQDNPFIEEARQRLQALKAAQPAK